MTRRAFLGIDCGTQSTRALLVDADTEAVLGSGRAAHALIQADDGTREQQPGWWVSALVDATRAALAVAGDVEVAGIGVSGQQHGLVCLGSDDQPVRSAKLWNDTTTAEECALLTSTLGGSQRVLELTGNIFLPGYTAPKILWLLLHEPAHYAATTRMCLPHDYLNLWLTGNFVTEPGDASGTAYVDVRTREYSPPVLAAIDAQRDWASCLPRIGPSLSVVGGLRPEASTALGIAAGTPVSGGGGDNMLAAIGVGAIVEGPVVVSLGTSGTGFAYRSRPAIDPRGEAAAFCDSTGAWLPLVCTLNCTMATDWVTALFGMDYAGLEAALTVSPPGARGLTFLPHLAGERTPDCPTGTGVFSGVRAEHGAADFVRSVVEGVSFGLGYALGALRRAGVEASQVTLVGGGAQSDGWAQVCADVFEVPVVRPTETEAAALGAARQARWAVDGISPTPGDDRQARRFEPSGSSALNAARARADRLRELAMENGV
ncbi:MAG: xylulokinase [Chloroflexi bacterium]|nr:xylulokinase [Chloroflexota bacterium]